MGGSRQIGHVQLGKWCVRGYVYPAGTHIVVVKYGDGYAVGNQRRETLTCMDGSDDILTFSTPDSAEALIRYMLFNPGEPDRHM